jgi:hypothetical protein
LLGDGIHVVMKSDTVCRRLTEETMVK